MTKLILFLILTLATQTFAGISDNGQRQWTLLNTTDSVNAVQSGTWNTGRTWSLLNSTDSVNSVQSGTWSTGRTWSLLNTTDSVNSVQSGTWTTGRTWSLLNSTDSVNAVQSGTWTVQQGTAPWSENITEFGGTNISTGTGASGAGIPRVTVSNDSNILATQSGAWTTGRTWTLSNTTDSVVAVPVDGVKTTYSASIVGLVTAATASDIFIINGSGTKTIRVTNISFSMTTTSGSGSSVNLSLVKRSTANTGGTSTTLTDVPHDSNNAAGTATVLAYTVNPTSTGTSVGVVRTYRYSVAASNTVLTVNWQFGTRPSQDIVLRGTAQGLAINFNAGSFTGSIADIDIEWTEE